MNRQQLRDELIRRGFEMVTETIYIDSKAAGHIDEVLYPNGQRRAAVVLLSAVKRGLAWGDIAPIADLADRDMNPAEWASLVERKGRGWHAGSNLK